jgi:hypothetical protein
MKRPKAKTIDETLRHPKAKTIDEALRHPKLLGAGLGDPPHGRRG